MKRMSGATLVMSTMLVLAGCATVPPPEPPPPEPIVESSPVLPPPVKPVPQPVAPPPPSLPSVAIVLTSQQAAYADVARELAQHFDEFEIVDLSSAGKPPVSVLGAINDSDSEAIIAIGLRAAKSSVAMAEVPVVFSQVFNYRDHNLVTDNSRGIAPLAPMALQLGSWAALDSDLNRVGILIGEGHDELIAEARKAALAHEIDLQVEVVSSDQEAIYFFRRMVRSIDGFLLVPDNRILSHRALKEIIEVANRHQVAVAVPTEPMLALGADLSLSTVDADIARTTVDVLRKIQAGNLTQLPPVTELTDIEVVLAKTPPTQSSVTGARQ
ncbi:MAG: ABC transporter substrate binding protein [Pseudomonadota bacterium]